MVNDMLLFLKLKIGKSFLTNSSKFICKFHASRILNLWWNVVFEYFTISKPETFGLYISRHDENDNRRTWFYINHAWSRHNGTIHAYNAPFRVLLAWWIWNDVLTWKKPPLSTIMPEGICPQSANFVWTYALVWKLSTLKHRASYTLRSKLHRVMYHTFQRGKRCAINRTIQFSQMEVHRTQVVLDHSRRDTYICKVFLKFQGSIELFPYFLLINILEKPREHADTHNRSHT